MAYNQIQSDFRKIVEEVKMKIKNNPYEEVSKMLNKAGNLITKMQCPEDTLENCLAQKVDCYKTLINLYKNIKSQSL